MENHGIGLDIRHVMLLADLITYMGRVYGILLGGYRVWVSNIKNMTKEIMMEESDEINYVERNNERN